MRRIVIPLFDDVQALDVTGPAEVFSLAARSGAADYRVEYLADGPVLTSAGLTLAPSRAGRGPVDTLVVPGGLGVRAAVADGRLVRRVRRTAPRARRVASVCTGAFVLAEAGLLDGRRATTHWAACDALGRQFPRATVERDPIFVRDGSVYTSAGVTAGIDLALALVEEDCGADVALAIARNLVLFLKRPGGQAQFSRALAGQSARRPALRELQDWLPENLDADLSVEALARRACMSPRNFARAFTREVGQTPAAYVAQVRLERARTLLETTEIPVEEVARRCGFGTVESLRRTFSRRVTTTPSEYRSRFRRRTHGHRHPAV